jgi:hypothetical protein
MRSSMDQQRETQQSSLDKRTNEGINSAIEWGYRLAKWGYKAGKYLSSGGTLALFDAVKLALKGRAVFLLLLLSIPMFLIVLFSLFSNTITQTSFVTSPP